MSAFTSRSAISSSKSLHSGPVPYPAVCTATYRAHTRANLSSEHSHIAVLLSSASRLTRLVATGDLTNDASIRLLLPDALIGTEKTIGSVWIPLEQTAPSQYHVYLRFKEKTESWLKRQRVLNHFYVSAKQGWAPLSDPPQTAVTAKGCEDCFVGPIEEEPSIPKEPVQLTRSIRGWSVYNAAIHWCLRCRYSDHSSLRSP